ncbi:MULTISPECIES: hypothetical protein [Planktothrix]|uniref:Uncharacterized protein n=2 Tax=Planktothrix TaxID=54304 RepID=A0A6J7ZIS4_PLARU|nr:MULTISPECIES: hypothetical protein [Planktothrix]MCF3606664.1 hypothetical protein [Planktothrix agardhii 1033]CAC5343805.1 hypothetical protein PLAN_40220 [Planktothrix rubescens NIVA-CYA 18]CAD5981255.1 hypothetical protein PCC7821_04735 [Planktothrix rubescens NIVA-CYA 18]
MNIIELILVGFSACFSIFYPDLFDYKSSKYQDLISQDSDNFLAISYTSSNGVDATRLDRMVIRDLVQTEISQSFRRVHPLLSTWILVAVLVPSASVLSILILFFKITRDSRKFSQHLETLKDDFIPEFYARIGEAQDIVYDLQDSFQVTEEAIQGIQARLDSLSTQDDDLEEYTVEDDKHRLRNRRVTASKS